MEARYQLSCGLFGTCASPGATTEQGQRKRKADRVEKSPAVSEGNPERSPKMSREENPERTRKVRRTHREKCTERRDRRNRDERHHDKDREGDRGSERKRQRGWSHSRERYSNDREGHHDRRRGLDHDRDRRLTETTRPRCFPATKVIMTTGIVSVNLSTARIANTNLNMFISQNLIFKCSRARLAQ